MTTHHNHNCSILAKSNELDHGTQVVLELRQMVTLVLVACDKADEQGGDGAVLIDQDLLFTCITSRGQHARYGLRKSCTRPPSGCHVRDQRYPGRATA